MGFWAVSRVIILDGQDGSGLALGINKRFSKTTTFRVRTSFGETENLTNEAPH